jgi:hypothetical protein
MVSASYLELACRSPCRGKSVSRKDPQSGILIWARVLHVIRKHVNYAQIGNVLSDVWEKWIIRISSGSVLRVPDEASTKILQPHTGIATGQIIANHISIPFIIERQLLVSKRKSNLPFPPSNMTAK